MAWTTRIQTDSAEILSAMKTLLTLLIPQCYFGLVIPIVLKAIEVNISIFS
jgi:hypothetical protein